jgi:hypothetical protein
VLWSRPAKLARAALRCPSGTALAAAPLGGRFPGRLGPGRAREGPQPPEPGVRELGRRVPDGVVAVPPAVEAPGRVAAGRGHDVGAVGLDVEPGPQPPVGGRERLRGHAEVQVQPAAAGLRRHGWGQPAQLLLEAGEGLAAAAAGVDVDDQQVGGAPGPDPDVGPRPPAPPALDRRPVGRRPVDAAPDQRVLARPPAGGAPAAGAGAVAPDGVARPGHGSRPPRSPVS